MNITILGAGAWGTALAISLAERHNVVLWGRNKNVMQEIAVKRENSQYLPDIALPQRLNVTSDLANAIAHVSSSAAANDALLIVAASVAGLRPLVQQLQSHPIPNLVWLCKGLEENTQLLPHQVVREVLGNKLAIGTLSGPSFAQEVANGLPCALVMASDNASLRELVVSAVHSRTVRVYSTDDLVGVEVGGAVKNVLAIATGVIDGLGFGLNARAALITRGLVEITRLGVALGGRTETFMGLAGMGDLILTCTGNLSRNRKVGLALSEGKQLDTIIAELGHVAEGVRCAQAVRTLAQRCNIEMPIADAVAGVLFDGNTPQEMVVRLLSRDPRDESAS